MSTDLSICITIIGLALSVATFYIGRQTASKQDGRAAGALETDLRYVKESVSRIESKLDRDTQRLEGRIDELSIQLTAISEKATRAYESAKSAHNRVDEHLEREHDIPRRGGEA
jgi:5-bromo-4-chloroindolyl phosphate hydrolysis protein